MTDESLLALEDALIEEERLARTSKGDLYASTHDALDNFKRNGERLGLHPRAVCGLYLMKHIDSILLHARKTVDDPEGIRSRIVDARNYLLFMAALCQEEGKDWKFNKKFIAKEDGPAAETFMIGGRWRAEKRADGKTYLIDYVPKIFPDGSGIFPWHPLRTEGVGRYTEYVLNSETGEVMSLQEFRSRNGNTTG